MMNEFKKYYEETKKLHEEYDANKGNEAALETLRKEYANVIKEINSRGTEYAQMFRAYSYMQDRGNEYLDLADLSILGNPEEVISLLRNAGVTQFVFASGWSSSNETAWEITQQGCTLAGMVEINGNHKHFMSDEYEKVHGFLFNVN